MNDQQKKAGHFLALHQSPATLVLPNVWDVSSTMIFSLEGFKAIGTTSADIESGYATDVDGVVRSAEAVLAAGAVGLNLEGSTSNIKTPLSDMLNNSKRS